jgi:hypothetical protein
MPCDGALFPQFGVQLGPHCRRFQSEPGRKGQEIGLFEGFGMVAHPGVDATLSGVVVQIFPLDGSSVIINCRSGNRCPSSVKITLDQRAEGGWTLVQGSV